ncbi:hypothetical protein C8R43DRAFT_1127192 [Mycena crocata]|nr:hypothetical protein C8R43DRAFT_1127192 [Mycena crocata]
MSHRRRDRRDPTGPGSQSNPLEVPDTSPAKKKRIVISRGRVTVRQGRVSPPLALETTRSSSASSSSTSIVPYNAVSALSTLRTMDISHERKQRAVDALASRGVYLGPPSGGSLGPPTGILGPALHPNTPNGTSHPWVGMRDDLRSRIEELEVGAFGALQPIPPEPMRRYPVRASTHVTFTASLDARTLINGPLPPPTDPAGWRLTRRDNLVHRDLWVGGDGPTEQLPVKGHHKCGICHMVRSHPVTYACGHSHCYVCIRLWLERQWTCPECVTPMYRAPFRVFFEEATLAEAYPEWKDRSVVKYSWDGLRFPEEPKDLVEALVLA